MRLRLLLDKFPISVILKTEQTFEMKGETWYEEIKSRRFPYSHSGTGGSARIPDRTAPSVAITESSAEERELVQLHYSSPGTKTQEKFNERML